VNLLLLTVWTLISTPSAAFTDQRLWVFCAIGLFVPGFSRLLLILSTQKVGASRSSSIRSTSPLVATVIAILWLKESPTPLNLLGILLIVVGATFLSKKSRQEPLWHRRDLLFPLGGMFLMAMRDVTIRFGLGNFPYPLAGAWAATLVSTLVIGAYWWWTRTPDEKMPPSQGWVYFVVLGVGVSLGLVFLFFAFQTGTVALVSPIAGSTPLFTLFFSAIFLRDLEKMTAPLLIGSLFIVCGVVLVALQL
jgi:drug/metabolite transporter (DMT)-like permease